MAETWIRKLLHLPDYHEPNLEYNLLVDPRVEAALPTNGAIREP